MKFITTNKLNQKQKEAILFLWNKEYPINIKYSGVKEFDDYLNKLLDKRHLVIEDDNNKIKGWYCDFIRDDSRWFAMVLDNTIQGQGIGSEVINRAKEQNIELNGWVARHNNYIKSNGEQYMSPIEFYVKNGFEIFPDKKFETDKLSLISIKWEKI